MAIKRFTINEFRTLYPDNDACLDKLFQLRYRNLICPKCESDKPFTKVKDRRAYQCPSCSFQIYPTRGTVFEKSTTPLTHWFYAIFLQTTTRNGVAAKELERQLNVCYKTALRMAHQIKILMSKPISLPFTGVIQADETFIGGLNKNRHADKKIPNSQGRSVKDKIPVLGMMNMSGKIIAKVITDTSRISITPILRENMKKDACVLVTDEWWAYREIGEEMPHVVINHTIGEYVSGAFHTNTIEGFWSQLKRTIKGTHIHVSRKHLQKYVDEVAFRYMNKDKQDTMFETILSHVV
jgi:transposase-like protein